MTKKVFFGHFSQGYQVHHKKDRSYPAFRRVLTRGPDTVQAVPVFSLSKLALYQVALVALFSLLSFLVGREFYFGRPSQGFAYYSYSFFFHILSVPTRHINPVCQY